VELTRVAAETLKISVNTTYCNSIGSELLLFELARTGKITEHICGLLRVVTHSFEITDH